MKKISLFLLCMCSLGAVAQTDSLEAVADIKEFQEKLNEEYKDRKQSPLDPDDFSTFQGHDFFPIDLDYRVNAKLTISEGTPFFAMKTTTSRLSTERIYGYVAFTLAGKEFRLPVYQSKDLMQTQEYGDYLFFPFSDETNGKRTYGGGRYIDLRIPKEGDNIIIDFNKAYNPYCAYSSRFSCPLVPAENQLDVEVPAGVMYHKKAQSNTSESEVQGSEIFENADVQPEFPGGYPALMEFIKKKLRFPRAAMSKGGTVYVQFTVARDGSITDIRTIRSVSKACDREAERVVSLMPKWKPGQINGEPVAVRFIMPFKFQSPWGD